MHWYAAALDALTHAPTMWRINDISVSNYLAALVCLRMQEAPPLPLDPIPLRTASIATSM